MTKQANKQEPFNHEGAEQSSIATVAMVSAVVGALGIIATIF